MNDSGNTIPKTTIVSGPLHIFTFHNQFFEVVTEEDEDGRRLVVRDDMEMRKEIGDISLKELRKAAKWILGEHNRLAAEIWGHGAPPRSSKDE